jgi:type II secretory pathway component PulF
VSELTFHYRAVDVTGGQSTGTLRARSRDDAYRQIVAMGVRPLQIKGRQSGRRLQRITLKDLSQFTYEFAVLMEAGIPIVEGLRSIGEQHTNLRLRGVIEDVSRQVEAGSSVADALGAHQSLFGEVYVQMIRAAEVSGNLNEVLQSLGDMLDRQYEMAKNIKGALLYPICVVGALALAVSFLMIFVIPRFAHMFESRGVELPLATQLVIGLSDLLRHYWYVLLAGVGIAIWALHRLWRDPNGRQRIDTFLHRIPFMRDVLRGLAVGRFANVLGIALRSGLGLIESLDLAASASGRPLLQAGIARVQEQVKLGSRLSDVLHECLYLPAFTRRMFAAGEEAGNLARMCEIVARNHDRESVHLAKNVTTVVEPLLIVGLAATILIIALAVFLPMWNMAALIG